MMIGARIQSWNRNSSATVPGTFSTKVAANSRKLRTLASLRNTTRTLIA